MVPGELRKQQKKRVHIIYNHSTEHDSTSPCSETSGDVVVALASELVGVNTAGGSSTSSAFILNEVVENGSPFCCRGRSLKLTHFCTVIRPVRDGSIRGMRRVERRCC